uniref:hypothetical protein n=1 Tax=Aeromonas sp. Ne-1 TaxID=1675689 RepID=UPI0015631BC8
MEILERFFEKIKEGFDKKNDIQKEEEKPLSKNALKLLKDIKKNPEIVDELLKKYSSEKLEKNSEKEK